MAGRIKSKTAVLLFAVLLSAPRMFAVDGVPRWEQVLNEVLGRSEQERRAPNQRANAAITAPGHMLPPSERELKSHANRALRPAIAGFVRYFQGPGLKNYQASVRRLGEYRPMIQRILHEEGLPVDLMWIGLVESGYDPRAKSPKDALGIWQLIPETAATFGLKMDQRDERTDPEKSTRAAARYLKWLYGRFGDWTLALAAYNAGERRVQSVIDQAHDRDFWHLAASGMLPRETQAYVPAVLAAQSLGEDSSIEEGSSAFYDDATKRTAKVEFAPFALTQ